MRKRKTKSGGSERQFFGKEYLTIAIMSISALVLTFFVSSSALGMSAKIASFLVIVFAFSFVSAGLHWKFRRIAEVAEAAVPEEKEEQIFTKDVEEKIAILDEAGKFFSASLKSDDMFRLIVSRIEEVVPHISSVLYLADSEDRLKASYAFGKNSRSLKGVSMKFDQGLAGKAFMSSAAEIDHHLFEDRRHIKPEVLSTLNSGLAVPLKRGVETFGVLVLYGKDFDETDKIRLEAMGERVAPLLVGSFSFEQSISNSMVDSLTKLPNERAFYLVLENQIAESQRFPEQRPLTILTIDLRDFADFNRLHGHSMGDNLLGFASDVIAGALRQMDFLCRSMNDEFWVVLPTASDEITEQVVKRIEQALLEKSFQLPGNKRYRTILNFGAATFLRDGETPNQLLQKALLRKKQSKQGDESSVIIFPREYVN